MKAEQADGRTQKRRGYRWFIKRQARRLLRRLGKQLKDNAPKKHFYSGYET